MSDNRPEAVTERTVAAVSELVEAHGRTQRALRGLGDVFVDLLHLAESCGADVRAHCRRAIGAVGEFAPEVAARLAEFVADSETATAPADMTLVDLVASTWDGPVTLRRITRRGQGIQVETFEMTCAEWNAIPHVGASRYKDTQEAKSERDVYAQRLAEATAEIEDTRAELAEARAEVAKGGRGIVGAKKAAGCGT